MSSFGEEKESLSVADWSLGERTSSFGFFCVSLFFRRLEVTGRPVPAGRWILLWILGESPEGFWVRWTWPRMVVPPVAKFSSGIGMKRIMPRSGSTSSVLLMYDCKRTAFRLFVVGRS